VLWFAALLFCFSFVAINSNSAVAEQLAYAAPGPYSITGIQTTQSAEGIIVRVSGSAPPTFTMYELFEPQRIILDIADGSFAESLGLPKSPGAGPIIKITGRVLDDKEPVIARLEMFTEGEAAYTVERDVNDILISFKAEAKKVAAKAPSQPAAKMPAQEEPPVIVNQMKKTVAAKEQMETSAAAAGEKVGETAKPVKDVVAAIEAPVTITEEPVEPPAATASAREEESAQTAPAPLEEFGIAGFEKQAITVDFYKIDLHNVFRLFGEISGMNIVIAPGVGGTLTLALDNVPWDFVLDVILNLKNLQAIERFNTLVIAQQGAQFEWPEREEEEEEQINIKKDKSIIAEESFKVTQIMEMPPEVLEAQKLMRKALEKENQEDYEEALELYEQAYDIWPDNGKLANRLASMYLVHMGMNAKAVHYGKAALKVDENDRDSALYTAIGLANMRRLDEAKEYFEMAASGPKPASEALQSYAMFSEENSSYLEALLLLARHEDLYGDSLDTMIARARIFDKEGNSEKAASEYRAILLSGYQLPSDLARYIKGRLAMEGTKTK
jgi:type IV pilus assembly protein PilQ